MSEGNVWESVFAANELLWGLDAAKSALDAAEHFARSGVRRVLIPGIGYGRNARPFLDREMRVTGIEISPTAIALARSRLGLELQIHEGSVQDMPFDDATYEGIFCHGLLYLLDAPARAKLISDCYAQLAPGGHMRFTVISKEAPMYGRGTRLGDDWYEVSPGVSMYFYDHASVSEELGSAGLVETSEVLEPAAGGCTFPFLQAVCRKP